MLYFETITPAAREVLAHVHSLPEFGNVRLVGGTSLALQFGHRKSDDLDFFGHHELTMNEIAQELDKFGTLTVVKDSPAIKILLVNDLKIDFVNYNYPWIAGPKVSAGLNLAAAEDIAAMKIAAITGRGSKKDFFDLDLLLDLFPIGKMFDFYTRKYNDSSVYLALKSLLYFDDADAQQDPVLLMKRTWKSVRRRIETEVKNYLRALN